MAKYIDYQKLKEKLNIEDIVFHMLDLNLRETNTGYEGACPLCGGDEDSRRFKVTPSKGAFHCMNADCDASGNFIDLVAAVQDVSMPEAARRIADYFDLKDCEFKRNNRRAASKAKPQPEASNESAHGEGEEPKDDLDAMIDETIAATGCSLVPVMSLEEALRRIKAGTLDRHGVLVLDARTLMPPIGEQSSPRQQASA